MMKIIHNLQLQNNLSKHYPSMFSRLFSGYNVRRKNFGDIFLRNYFRSILVPKILNDQLQKIYIDEFASKIPTGNFNPSQVETLILKEKIVKFIRQNQSREDINNFMAIFHDFANQNYQNFNVLELIGLKQINNSSLSQNLYFKANSLSAILEIFDIKRSVYNDYPAIGFLKDNRRYIPAHCDKMQNDKIPQIVAIITINSNSKAITFFYQNHKILQKLTLLNPKSVEILQEVLISKNEVNEQGYFVKTTPHKIINHRKDGSVFIQYNFSNNPYFISDPKNCKYSQKEVDQAIANFCLISNKLKQSFKFTCDERENVIIFKNDQLVHGRTAVLENEIREMAYLPFDIDLKNELQTKNTEKFDNKKSQLQLIKKPSSSIIKPITQRFKKQQIFQQK